MSSRLRFVGGPADGRTLTTSGDDPPPRYLIPMPPSITELLADPLAAGPIPVAEYEPLRESGWPRRADDGAYLYGYRVPPVTRKERQALEQARRDVAAAEEKRAAELDETWQEIRRVRPHFPTDWRDLF